MLPALSEVKIMTSLEVAELEAQADFKRFVKAGLLDRKNELTKEKATAAKGILCRGRAVDG